MSLHALQDGNLILADKQIQERICVPLNCWALTLQEFHDTPLGGHFKKDKTFYCITQKYIWPNMYHHVEPLVTSCDACQKNKASHQQKMGIAQLPDLQLDPWEKMPIDLDF
jgi:hypothetical protein